MLTNTEGVDSESLICILNIHNYRQWSDLMLSYFLEHNLDGTVDGTEEQPYSPVSERQNWFLRQKTAAGFITRNSDASNHDLFINYKAWCDPKALWSEIELDYASKKARNRSRLFTWFLSLTYTNGDLAKYCSEIREIIREMSNSGVKLDDNLLAHMALHHLPSEYQTTRQVIITTAESLDTALTLNGVLS